MALGVLALCFALSVLGRGLGESFTVFLKPISESFGWDRAEVVSVYSLSALAGGLAAPLVGRLFDRSGPRTVYSLGLLLLGGGVPDRRPMPQHLWQFQLSLGLCVGIGIAFIGNVPNSILLGRWFGPRLPTAMAVVYSATGAGVLILLPASQILIDQAGWRGAYQIFGGIALVLAGAAIGAAVAAVFDGGSPHLVKSATADFADEGWTLLSAMRHHAFWALFSTFFFTAIGMYAHRAAGRRLSDRCRISAAAGGDRLGIQRRRAAVRHARRQFARRHHRPQAVGTVQLRDVDRRNPAALGCCNGIRTSGC